MISLDVYSRHSDDGRSDKGSDHDDSTSTTSKKGGSVAGGGTTASLLKKCAFIRLLAPPRPV